MLVLRSKAGEIMIRAIFKDKRMVGYATVGYYSSDPDEVVVELTEEQIKQIVGTEDWQDIYHTLFLENEDAEIGENLLPSLGDSKILPTEVANTQFRLLDDISEEELAFIMSKFPSFEIGKSYLVNEKVVFRSKLYKVIQAHTSQSDWTPDQVPALFVEVMPDGVIGPWRQPLGAHDAYKAGDKVYFNGHVYVCKVDNNIWSPDNYGWELFEEEEPGGDEYPDWVQPTGSHDAYQVRAIVTHNGQLWISTIDNNVWEPGIYGWSTFEA
jgi:hypothetical protein